MRDELVRILTEGDARRGFELLDESGLLDSCSAGGEGVPGGAAAAGISSGRRRLDSRSADAGRMHRTDPPLAAGVLLHDVGKPATFRIADRIRFDGHAEVGAEMAREHLARLRFLERRSTRLPSLVANHMRFKDVRENAAEHVEAFPAPAALRRALELTAWIAWPAMDTRERTSTCVRSRPNLEEELHPKPLINGKRSNCGRVHSGSCVRPGTHCGPDGTVGRRYTDERAGVCTWRGESWYSNRPRVCDLECSNFSASSRVEGFPGNTD